MFLTRRVSTLDSLSINHLIRNISNSEKNSKRHLDVMCCIGFFLLFRCGIPVVFSVITWAR